MKLKKKELVFILILIAVLLVVIITGAVKKKDTTVNISANGQSQSAAGGADAGTSSGEGARVNTSPKINQERTYKYLKFTNFQLTEDSNGMISLIADVTNTKSSDIDDYTMVDIIFYDENGQEIGSTLGLIKPLKGSETTQLNASFTYNVENATAYDLEIKDHEE